MQHEAFVSGNFDTKFIENYFKPEYLQNNTDYNQVSAFAAGELFFKGDANATQKVAEGNKSNWLQNRKA